VIKVHSNPTLKTTLAVMKAFRMDVGITMRPTAE
jgi:DNA-binding phage protein